MTVFDLQAKLGLDKGNFDKGVREAEGSGKGLSESLSDSFGKIKKAAKAFLTAAIFKEVIDGARELVTEIAEVGDAIDKQSQVLGISRRAYQEWDYILGQNGASIESLGMAMRTLNKAIEDGAEGNEEANNAFAQLGLSVHELELLNPEERFEKMVRALQKLPAGVQKSNLAIKLFGRSGTQLLPLLNQSETSIDELRARAEELGLIMSDEAVDSAVVYGDSLDDLKRTVNAFKYSIGSKLLPILTGGIQKLTDYASKLRKAYEENGFSGVMSTLIGDLKTHWPTWDDIKEWVIEKWNGIKEGFKSIARLVFGEDADGNIDWPTSEEWGQKIKQGLIDAWGLVKNALGLLLTLVFGEDENGGIAWPKNASAWFDLIKQGLIDVWNIVKGWLSGLLTIVFGEAKDGGIEWPDAKKLWEMAKGAFTKFWDAFKGFLSEAAVWTIGEIDLSTLSDPQKVWKSIEHEFAEHWDKIVPLITGGAGFPIGMLILGGAKEWWDNNKQNFEKWWEAAKLGIKAASQWLLGGMILPKAQDIIDAITDWWDQYVKPFVKLTIMSPVIEGVGDLAKFFGGYEEGSAGANILDFLVKSAIGNAKGNNYVPYDDFPARLHRGEMVLTASQARRYREGDSSGLDMDALVSGVVGAVREGMDGAQVNSYMDSTKVTNKTNSVTGRKLMARRFA